MVASLAVLFCSHAARAEERPKPRVVPQDLHEFALSKGCVPPANFFEMRFEVAPPYVYAPDTAPKQPAAALWCQPDPSLARYTLLFRPGAGDLALGDCPAAIPDQGHIGGLSLVRASHVRPISLVSPSSFHRVDNPKAPPLTESLGDRFLLKSESDGVGAYYVCHAGAWYFSSFD
jgi:hypothetical protein